MYTRGKSKKKDSNFGPIVKLTMPDFKGITEKYEKQQLAQSMKKQADLTKPQRLAPMQNAPHQQSHHSLPSQDDPYLEALQQSTQDQEEKPRPQDVKVKVVNPWIYEATHRDYLEQVKGLPARHATLIEKHKKVMRQKTFMHDHELQMAASAEKNDDGEGRRILEQEYEIFNERDLPPVRNIMRFDVWGGDKTPEEWVAHCQGREGPHAFSPVYDNHKYVWKAVNVRDYDAKEKKYEVQVVENGQIKAVQRLSLLFVDEDKDAFEERVNKCKELQGAVEAELRFTELVDSIPGDQVSRLQKEWKQAIVNRCVRETDRYNPDHYVQKFKHLIRVVEEEYIRQMKKCIVLRDMKDPKQQPRFEELKVPIKIEHKEVPYIGVVEVPRYNFNLAFQHIVATHWSENPTLVTMTKIFSNKCHEFMGQHFFQTDTKALELPLELRDMMKIQKNFHKAMRQKMIIQWREFLLGEMQDKVKGEDINFFQATQQEYLESALRPIIKRFELILNTFLREFVRTSVQDWVTFIRKFTIPTESDSDQWKQSEVPMLRISLHNEGGATKKKEDKKGGKDDKKKGGAKDKKEEVQEDPNITINFRPTIKRVEDFFFNAFEEMVRSTKEITNLETDLVPFVSMPQQPCFNVNLDFPWFQEAFAQVKNMFDESIQGPRELLEKFKKYEYVLNISSKDMIHRLWKEKPTIQQLRDQLEHLTRVMREVALLATDEVRYPMFLVETAFMKDFILKRSQRLADHLLKKISDFCSESVVEIHETFKEMNTRIMKKPEDEKELVDLKKFIQNAPKMVEDLQDKGKDVYNHMLILEDNTYRYPEKDSQMYFFTKQWPLQILAAISEGKHNIATQEAIFTQRLEQEKDRFFKDVERYQGTFEKIKKFSDFENVREHATDVFTLDDLLKKAEEQVESFNIREELFGQTKFEYDEFKKLVDDFKPFAQLWGIAHDVDLDFKEWKTGAFVKIDAAEIEGKVDRWSSDAYQLYKKLNEDFPEAAEVAQDLKQEIRDFSVHVPLIKALRTEAMKEEEWMELRERTGVTWLEANEQLTLQRMIDENLGKHLEIIEEVSVKAAKKFKLEKDLIAMKMEWKDIQFELFPYKSTFVLKGIDVVQTKLDDHTMTTQSMLGSQFMKGKLRQVTREWEKKLLEIMETLEEVMKTQRSWMYLEPIFGSDDITKKMPTEAAKFEWVDNLWKTTMEGSQLEPGVLDLIERENIRQNFEQANLKLDQIQKNLDDYLREKREGFPRFFFLADDDLLQILAQTKDPTLVQPHMSKCFEGINSVVFSEKQEVTAMVSAEGEVVNFSKKVDVNEGDKKGNVELWLLQVEEQMRKTLYALIKACEADFKVTPRTEWVIKWPGQIILTVNQMDWTLNAEEAIKKHKQNGLARFKEKLDADLADIVILVRGQLSEMARLTLGAMVVIDVHARDVIQDLVRKGVKQNNDFDWIAQLRYYWMGNEELKVCMVNAVLDYGYEYIGNSPRLVITPLTDRCYRTLMGAKHLNYGGAPEGPAGTGKTESVKDLAKALAVQCVVFNCQDGLDYLAMAKFFKGLGTSGAWCCFDEFNRIDLEVLSVIAQQILIIQTAIAAFGVRSKTFNLDGKPLKLNPQCAINITMNPGYAGRSELPDNLKALFRPCAMMVPDYSLIAEIMLYSYGFQEARNLARKVVASLRLSSEQLSTQDHYDFGMRALKAILVAAGSLRRKLTLEENKLALRALHDVNLPKFTMNDITLFLGITSDLFPNIELPPPDYGSLERAIRESTDELGLQQSHNFINKCIQLYETIMVRHGLMVVGRGYAGKSSIIKALQKAYGKIRDEPYFAPVQIYYINPKSLISNQLYGNFDEDTHEWTDGVIAITIRTCTESEDQDKKWVLFDGPVDAIWIENMNTVLDDNKKLCLSSGQIIKLKPTMNIMFEVQDLAVASPATVSRCGMVFLEPDLLEHHSFIKSYIQKQDALFEKNSEAIEELVNWFTSTGIAYMVKKGKLPVPQHTNYIVDSFLNILDSYLLPFRSDDVKVPKDLLDIMPNYLLFALIWSIGAALEERSRPGFSEFAIKMVQGKDVKMEHKLDLPEEWEPKTLKIKLLECKTIYDLFFDPEKNIWINWQKTIPPYVVPKEAQFHQLTIPTIDCIRLQKFFSMLALNNKHTLFVGPTGTGKTISIAAEIHSANFPEDKYVGITLNFSAQTSANQTQDIIDGKMDKRRRHYYGPTLKRKAIVFVDDLNMPQKEKYGAQPPIELLRQWMDYGGWYDIHQDREFRNIQDLIFVAAMGPPSGGRNQITGRYLRHYNVVYVEPYDATSLDYIFVNVMKWYFSTNTNPPYPRSIEQLQDSTVTATVQVYNEVTNNLRPTPAKSHYTYNLRDVSKVFQGISIATHKSIRNDGEFVRLWAHECLRVFSDRLINVEDRDTFQRILKDVMKQNFKRDWEKTVTVEPLLFGTFVPMIYPDEDPSKKPFNNLYCELNDHQLLRTKIEDYLEDYNSIPKFTRMNLVIFMAAIEHVVRISRIISLPFGNALLVGVGGSGRKSMTNLACFIGDFQLRSIEISKNYGMKDWHDNMREILKEAGIDARPTVFLLSDTQIAVEGFVEDINNILNNGEIPNLFAHPEDKALVEEGMREMRAFKELNDTEVYLQFVERSRQNLHVVLAFSPIGEAFRRRLRMFPSLVNCSTIDWFLPWPNEALQTVAQQFLQEEELDNPEAIVSVCVDMQERVAAVSEEFKQEMRRYNYVTPTSYLELISTFKLILRKRREMIQRNIDRYSKGLKQLSQATTTVLELEEMLDKLRPELEKAQEETKKMIEDIAIQQKDVDIKTKSCEVDEKICKEKMQNAAEIEADCKAELAKVEPIYREAVDAVKKLESSDITEVKQTQNPNEGTRTVIQTLCMLFEIKPDKIRGQTAKEQTQYDYWKPAQKNILNSKLKDRCINYDKENMKPDIVALISPILDTDAYSDKVLKNASKAAFGLGKWVRAMVRFYEANKIITPKREALALAQKQLKEAQAIYAEKKAELDAVIELMKKLMEEFEEAKAKKERLEKEYDDCNAKKKRAGELVEGLADEKQRWGESREVLEGDMKHIVGDVIISSGVIAYLGAFTMQYRTSCINSWLLLLKNFDVQVAQGFSLKKVLGDDVKIRDWQLNELPTDDFSTENAIILQNSKRWPLMIDPQMQANIWIRKSYDQLKVIKPSQSGVEISRILESCIPYGRPILLEDCGENIDPLLEPVLRKQTFKQGGITYLKMGESPIEYADEFKFVITTKLSRPHYAPEICVSVAMLNFMVTQDGLLDQMLNMVVRHEEEKVAKERDAMIIQAAESKKELRNCENQILDLISSTPAESLLDDDVLIETLKGSKTKSNQIKKQMEDQKKIMEKNEAVRLTYKVVAFRVSQLFFCIMDLGGVESMYQYSLRWFKDIARLSMETADPGKGAKRLEALNSTFTRLLYENVCRSLFEKDKLLFSFLLTIKIMQGGIPQPHLAKKQNREELLYRGDSRVNQTELRFMLTGNTWVDSKKPNPSADSNGHATWLNELTWLGLQELSAVCKETFDGFDDSFAANSAVWRAVYDSQAPILTEWPAPWEKKLTFFQRLIVVRILRPDRCTSAIQELIVKEMGKKFISPPTFNLQICFNDSRNSTPIIFVLSPGADPISELQKLAKSMGFGNKWKPLSLGQGQTQFALDSISEALTRGEWVVLQNCHLAPSFMPILEGVVEKIEDDPNSTFRLWLTSMPSDLFPVSILQNGVKLTNEPPKGLRQNMLRSLHGIDQDTFESCQKPQAYKKLFFGLCFFNAVILERRKYGALGWNIPYQFSQSDLRISQSQLLMFLNEYAEIPWEALTYMVAEANYGGRVTDPNDRRSINIILSDYYTTDILKDDYHFTSGAGKECYYAPQDGNLASYIQFVEDKFPINDLTEVFGLHDNAEITSAIKDTTSLLSTVLAMMPRAKAKGGRSDDEIIDDMAKGILEKLPQNFDLEQASKKHPIRQDESMNTVLQQELLRFNRLLAAIRGSLQNLRKAIKGLVVMSGELESMITSLFNNQVPELWVKASYPSLKPLGAYVNDFILRLKFMGDWIEDDAPPSFWISGFYFTQSFLTGTMQNFARKYVIPIDTLMFDFFVIIDKTKHDVTKPAPDGVYIHGLYLEGAQYDMKRGYLSDQNPKELFFQMPNIWLLPKTNVQREKEKKTEHVRVVKWQRYICPVYKTSKRAGTLSTTGHSTNFVLYIELQMGKQHNEEFWVKRGVAMLTQLDY